MKIHKHTHVYSRDIPIAEKVLAYDYNEYNCAVFIGNLEHGIPRIFVNMVKWAGDNDLNGQIVQYYQHFEGQWYEAEIGIYGGDMVIQLYEMDPQFLPACNHGLTLLSK